MNNIEVAKLIPIKLFNTCLVNNTTKESIIELYPTRKHGAYYLDKFSNFLKDNYQMSIKNYCTSYLNIDWPKCPISNKDVGYTISGKGLKLNTFARGCISKEHSEKFAKACEKFSIERKGSNNPMYGKVPWNKGKDKRNPKIKELSLKMKERRASEETRIKQSEAARKRLIHGHTGRKHSRKAVEKMRERTAARWAAGDFNRVTSIHIKMRQFLNELNLVEKYIEEYQVKYFSMDFAFPSAKVAIECQGTYFHVDPRIYPNGPINSMQRRNYGRDKVKKQICEKEGWTIIPVWETEINDGTFKEVLKCELLKLNLLNQ